ncbi:MAG: radical SAM protein [Candidatus Sumerlaeia bacterium]|nr:radical SAM protein [Candidatus Sumerlaeia bacterium]
MTDSAIRNLGICPKCDEIVPLHHEERDGKVYLRKDCPKCGVTETLVASNIARWRAKRDLCGYQGEAEATCSVRCMECDHGKPPTLVFVDVTNRCNMNCPICLANIPAMGFKFDPPMAYFEKIFKKLATYTPKPRIQLFGGEPTVRDDLIDIILLAKSLGLSARVVTNGIRLANEDYCRRLLETGCQLMFAFDGRHPDIYRRLRKSEKSLDLKRRALDNVRKYFKSKVTLMSCAGLGVNDQYIADLIAFCHERRDYIAALDLIPLVETWGPEQVEAGDTTIDDVEQMVAAALPGTEFVPSGIFYKFPTFRALFNMRFTFGGAHPNCESVTMLVSDGEQYRPVSNYLKYPLGEVARQAMALDKMLGEKVDRSLLGRLFGRRGQQVVVGWALVRFLHRVLDLRAIFGDHPWWSIARLAGGLIAGRKFKDLMRRHSRCENILRVIVLPFEEPKNVESARLVECPAQFAYEHPLTHEIKFMPVCAWSVYRNGILKETTRQYGLAESA